MSLPLPWDELDEEADEDVDELEWSIVDEPVDPVLLLWLLWPDTWFDTWVLRASEAVLAAKPIAGVSMAGLMYWL